MCLRERSPRDGIQFSPTAQPRKGSSPLQFAKLLLGRGALPSKAGGEFSLDVSLWDPFVGSGSGLPQSIPWAQAQSLWGCPTQYMGCQFAPLLKTFSPPLQSARETVSQLVGEHHPKGSCGEPGHSSPITSYASRTMAGS